MLVFKMNLTKASVLLCSAPSYTPCTPEDMEKNAKKVNNIYLKKQELKSHINVEGYLKI